MAAKKAGAKKKTSRAGTQPANRPKGWGGSKQGESKHTPRKALTFAGPGRGNYSKDGEGRLERQARHAEEMRQLYYDVAATKDVPIDTRLKAATHLLDRTEGLPVQKVITAESDPLTLMDDESLDQELARQRDIANQFERDRLADEAAASKPAV